MRLSSGQYTLLIDLQALGAGPDQNPLLARMYTGANLGHPPLFDGTDLWPVDPASLASPHRHHLGPPPSSPRAT